MRIWGFGVKFNEVDAELASIHVPLTVSIITPTNYCLQCTTIMKVRLTSCQQCFRMFMTMCTFENCSPTCNMNLKVYKYSRVKICKHDKKNIKTAKTVKKISCSASFPSTFHNSQLSSSYDLFVRQPKG